MKSSWAPVGAACLVASFSDEDESEEEEVGKSNDGKREDVLKSFSKEQKSELQAIFKAHDVLVEKNANLEKELKTEREIRLNREFSDKASEFKHLGETSKIATVLKSASEKSPEYLKEIEGILKAADAQIAKGDLFKERGSSHTADAGSAQAKLDALVESQVQKSDGKLTKEQVYDQVMQSPEGRKLYSEIKKSRKGEA